MYLARIIGRVVSTVKQDTLHAVPLQWLQPVDGSGQDVGEIVGLRQAHRRGQTAGVFHAEQALRRCQQMLALTEDLEEETATTTEGALRGQLRLTCSVSFAFAQMGAAIADFLAQHPQLKIDLDASEGSLNLVEKRIDLAIRVGNLEDSSLVARHIGDSRMLLCAAPAYLLRKPLINHPQDLIGLDWLILHGDNAFNVLELHGPDAQLEKLRVESRVGCNNILAVRHFTLAGMGVSLQPEQEVREELANGSLRELLPTWRLPPFGIYLVTPRRDAQPAKVRYAIEALRQHLQTF